MVSLNFSERRDYFIIRESGAGGPSGRVHCRQNKLGDRAAAAAAAAHLLFFPSAVVVVVGVTACLLLTCPRW